MYSLSGLIEVEVLSKGRKGGVGTNDVSCFLHEKFHNLRRQAELGRYMDVKCKSV